MTTIHSFIITMFNKFFQSIFTNSDNYIASTACDSIHVDVLTGTARVMFKDDNRPQIYEYTNVSRRAIMNFMRDDARSLGKFVNNVLTDKRVQVSTIF